MFAHSCGVTTPSVAYVSLPCEALWQAKFLQFTVSFHALGSWVSASCYISLNHGLLTLTADQNQQEKQSGCHLPCDSLLCACYRNPTHPSRLLPDTSLGPSVPSSGLVARMTTDMAFLRDSPPCVCQSCLFPSIAYEA